MASAARECIRYTDDERVAEIGIDRGQPSRLYVDTLAWVTDTGETSIAEPERSVVLVRVVQGLQELGAGVELFWPPSS